jgi:DNA-directed RNA polymerase subunit RPC12/RpoP
MPTKIAAGDQGERDVVRLVKCPNCANKLMTLPRNYPMYDVQCTGCSFRAQVKTNLSKPKNEIFGAGWDIVEKVLKAGFTIPPLIVNYCWETQGISHRQIVFFPFIPKKNLRKRQLSPTARRANYRMFNYIGLLTLPQFVLLKTEEASDLSRADA